MHSVRKFLAPDLKKLLITVFLCLIGAAGQIQTWAFSEIGPKPPLYDILGSAPFWVSWVLLLAPMYVSLKAVGIELPHLPDWLFIFLNVVYFYLIACIAGWVIDLVRKRING